MKLAGETLAELKDAIIQVLLNNARQKGRHAYIRGFENGERPPLWQQEDRRCVRVRTRVWQDTESGRESAADRNERKRTLSASTRHALRTLPLFVGIL